MSIEITKDTPLNTKLKQFSKLYGSVFHNHEYLSEVGKYYCCLVAKNEESIIGILPLVKTRKYRFTAYHIPPYTHLFGPVIHPEYRDKSHQIICALINALPESGHYDFKMYLEEQDITPWLANGFNITAIQTHFVSKEIEYNLSCLSKDKSRDIRKLQSALESKDIEIIENNQNSKKLIKELWIKTASRSNFKIHGKILDAVLKAKIPNYCNVIIDKFGTPIAGTFCPYDSINMYHVIGASVRVEDSLLKRANMLSLYRAILYANSKGLNFDTEGSSIPGVANFYRMMGGQPKVIYRAQKSPSLYYQILRAGKTYLNERK